ncbi:MAG: hypothetical protein U0401_08165 [Anaerolineae bacterium]
MEQPDVLAGHVGVAALAFVFALLALALSGQSDRRPLAVDRRRSG